MRRSDLTDAAANVSKDNRPQPKAVRARVERLEKVLERLFVVPLVNQPVGLDALLSFIPGIGTVSGAAMGSYLAWEARNLGLPMRTLARMALNIGLDMLLGAIPVVGVIPDLFFRSNSRNLRLIKQHLDKQHPEP